MRKLSESVWMDIHKHSNGDIERIEDDINSFGLKELCEYTKSRYNLSFDSAVHLSETTKGLCLDAVICEGGKRNILFFVQYNEKERIIQFSKDIVELFPYIYQKLLEKYHIANSYLYSDNNLYAIYRSELKDVDNKLFIEVVDIIVDNFPTDFKKDIYITKKMKKLSESVWMDIHKRSNKDIERKENIAASCVIDGEKWYFTSDFWNMGEEYKRDTGKDWEAFAFYKMPNGSHVISGDTDAAGFFGVNDLDFYEDCDVYALKDYLEYTGEELAKRSFDDFRLYDAYYFAQPILEKYIKEVFKSHMSEYAKFWIEQLKESGLENTMVVLYNEGTDFSEIDGIRDEFDQEIEDANMYLFPDFDGWAENLEKELTEAYEKEGWIKSKTFDIDPRNSDLPSGRNICFVKFD